VAFKGEKLTFDENWKNITCGFGPQFLKLGALPILPTVAQLAKLEPHKPGDETSINGIKYQWEEYCFSWQHGVENDPGHQGYHGLKGQMYDDFIRLGAPAEEKMSKIHIPEETGNYYILSTSVIANDKGNYDKAIRLNKGANAVLAVYSKSCETFLTFRKPGVPKPRKQPISMRWYNDTGLLPFDYSFPSGAKSALFAFESAPGLISFTVRGSSSSVPSAAGFAKASSEVTFPFQGFQSSTEPLALKKHLVPRGKL